MSIGEKAVSAGTQVTHSADGTGAEGANVVIVVVGERPYAEMHGDDLELELSEEDRIVVANAAAAGVPVTCTLSNVAVASWLSSEAVTASPK